MSLPTCYPGNWSSASYHRRKARPEQRQQMSTSRGEDNVGQQASVLARSSVFLYARGLEFKRKGSRGTVDYLEPVQL